MTRANAQRGRASNFYAARCGAVRCNQAAPRPSSPIFFFFFYDQTRRKAHVATRQRGGPPFAFAKLLPSGRLIQSKLILAWEARSKQSPRSIGGKEARLGEQVAFTVAVWLVSVVIRPSAFEAEASSFLLPRKRSQSMPTTVTGLQNGMHTNLNVGGRGSETIGLQYCILVQLLPQPSDDGSKGVRHFCNASGGRGATYSTASDWYLSLSVDVEGAKGCRAFAHHS